jgi:hypothetical protein
VAAFSQKQQNAVVIERLCSWQIENICCLPLSEEKFADTCSSQRSWLYITNKIVLLIIFMPIYIQVSFDKMKNPQVEVFLSPTPYLAYKCALNPGKL